MATFSFRQDVEVIAVRETFYNVEADSLEEAREKLKKYASDDMLTFGTGNLEADGIHYLGDRVYEDDTRDYLGFTGDYPDVFTYDGNGKQVR